MKFTDKDIEEINILKSKYYKFYTNNNFNINPTLWDTRCNYINNSFNYNFRQSNAYIWQSEADLQTYTDYYYTIKNIDADDLLDKTKEDQSYGVISYKVNNTIISRDLLDSILEIYFLKNNIKNFEQKIFLEIGAGYGRLCKRFYDCFPNIEYYIVDAIPESTFISRLYLGEPHYNQIINLYDLQEKTQNINIDVAINIHAFPEFNYSDIEWWIAFLSAKQVRYIFYVPNNPLSNPSFMPTNKNECIQKIFQKYNYDTIVYDNIYKKLDIHYEYAVPFFLLKQN